MRDALHERPPITRRQMAAQLRALGVVPEETVMLHCSLNSLGYVVGGADAVVVALLDVITSEGTLMALTGWEHDTYSAHEWPDELRRAYWDDPPIFDPAVSEAAREVGRLSERIRTWPGALRSDHPEASFTALGKRARWVTENHTLHHPYGEDSPLARLVEAGGHVLMLGAPLDTITLLHHAEELARVPNKKLVRYSVAVREGDGIGWREIEDIDTSDGALPYQRVTGDRDAFAVIADDALRTGIGRAGRVGQSSSHLFPAKELVEFAVAWIEARFA